MGLELLVPMGELGWLGGLGRIWVSSEDTVLSPSPLDTSSPPRATQCPGVVPGSLGTPLGALTRGGLRGFSRLASKREEEEEEEALSLAAEAWRRLLVRGVTWQNWGGCSPCKVPSPAAMPAGMQGSPRVRGGEHSRLQPWNSTGSSSAAEGFRAGGPQGPAEEGASPGHTPAPLGSSISTAVTKRSLSSLLSPGRSWPPVPASSTPRSPLQCRGWGGLLAPALGCREQRTPVPFRGTSSRSPPAQSSVLDARGCRGRAGPPGSRGVGEGPKEG